MKWHPYLRLFLVLSGVALVATASHVLCHRLGCGRKAEPTPMACWHDTSWLAAELKLTPEQRAKLIPLDAEYAAALGAAGHSHRRLHAELNQALFDAAVPATKAEELLAEMSQARLEADRATIHHIRAVIALLTPEQRKDFQALFAWHCNDEKGPDSPGREPVP